MVSLGYADLPRQTSADFLSGITGRSHFILFYFLTDLLAPQTPTSANTKKVVTPPMFPRPPKRSKPLSRRQKFTLG